MFRVPNQYRIKKGAMASTVADGNNGAFQIPHPKISGYFFMVIATDGTAIRELDQEDKELAIWEHVSVHIDSKDRVVDRCPTWQEMCFIKDIFWEKSDCVVQYHPAESEYVNCHPTTLHLWRPVDQNLVIPPKVYV